MRFLYKMLIVIKLSAAFPFGSVVSEVTQSLENLFGSFIAEVCLMGMASLLSLRFWFPLL